MNSSSPINRVILFEPRALVRSGVCSLLRNHHCEVVHCWSLEKLIETICNQGDDRQILLAGLGGIGNMIPSFIRILHFTRSMSLTSFVYLPVQDVLLTKMLMGVGVDLCTTEDRLESELNKLFSKPSVAKRHGDCLSPAELNVLLDYASGLQTKEIATRRTCNYKTVFTFKRNARIRLNIENSSGWINLMSQISLLTSLYE